MTHMITCEVRPDALPQLKTLRLRHLQYIDKHRDSILFGGPARGEDGMPQTMIIVLKTDNADEAEGFIKSEPYTVSGKVFSSVIVRKWLQVMPDTSPNALKEAIASEMSLQKT